MGWCWWVLSCGAIIFSYYDILRGGVGPVLWHWCRPAYDRFPFSAGCWCALRSAAVVVWPFLGGLNAMKNYSAPAVQYLLLSLLPLLSAAYPAVVSPSNGRRRWTGSGERSELVAGGVTRIHFGSPKKFQLASNSYLSLQTEIDREIVNI